ncbi:hypothetical protein JCM10908_000851 [Rhodotorula pacifica]|uniref:huntingtin-interacting protein K n=1 Tax=Rhodotorula pacifica TaxID=1495444 RepID=UPI00316E0660
MLKAKAKAAATAAAQKRKAAAAAAAAQEAAAQQAAQASAFGPGSTTRSGRGLRPNVTQYWADSNAAALAPGGGIQRIGYDQATYEEAVRTIIFGEEAPEERKAAMGMIPPKEDSEEVKADGEEKGQELEGYKTNKEDLATILANFDITSAAASQALRQHKGDLPATLADLCGPQAVSSRQVVRA